MKKLQKICFRLSAVFAVLAVCSTLFVPARAEPIDYNDYVTKVQVDGDNDLVTVRIPADMAWVRVYNADNSYKEIYRGYGAVHDIPFEVDTTYRFEIDIFGYQYDDNGLDLSYIPVGTQIASGFSFNWDGDWSVMASPVPTVVYYFYEEGNQKYLYYDRHVLPDQTSRWDFLTDVYTLPSVDNADLLYVKYWWEPVNFFDPEAPVPHGITVQDTILVFSISSLLRQQQLTGKTNALLKEVELQLAEQGKTLDDIRDQNDTIIDQNDQIINGQVKPETPDGADRFDDLDDTEAGLRDDSQAGLDTGIEITKNALQIIMQYATAFACAGWIFECFSTLPIFTALLFVSMALGVFGLVVNLAHDVDRAHRVKSAKANRTKKGG